MTIRRTSLLNKSKISYAFCLWRTSMGGRPCATAHFRLGFLKNGHITSLAPVLTFAVLSDALSLAAPASGDGEWSALRGFGLRAHFTAITVNGATRTKRVAMCQAICAHRPACAYYGVTYAPRRAGTGECRVPSRPWRIKRGVSCTPRTVKNLNATTNSVTASVSACRERCGPDCLKFSTAPVHREVNKYTDLSLTILMKCTVSTRHAPTTCSKPDQASTLHFIDERWIHTAFGASKRQGVYLEHHFNEHTALLSELRATFDAALRPSTGLQTSPTRSTPRRSKPLTQNAGQSTAVKQAGILSYTAMASALLLGLCAITVLVVCAIRGPANTFLAHKYVFQGHSRQGGKAQKKMPTIQI